jgi:8-oxo-dGTP pyrophosphatase MutT (NUDIX family)
VTTAERAVEEVRACPPSALREQVLAVLTTAADPFDRDLRPAHVTASAVVLSEDRSWVLLVRHKKLGLWLQPGGHVDPGDACLADAARREAVEETGVPDARIAGGPVDLHRHPAPCQPRGAADHLDIRFLALAPLAAIPVVSDESTDARWFPVDDLPADAVAELATLVAVARGGATGQDRPRSAIS